jgi:dihydrofolate synthase/folylpolyglutamate synthase
VTVHAPDVQLPGRLELRHGKPLEIWDGAHTPEAVRWLASRLPRSDHVLVLSILTDKDLDGMLDALSTLGRRVVATSSSSPRALPAAVLADRASGYFEAVETAAAPRAAVERARGLAGPGGAVLVTGSLYLLADLASREEQSPPCRNLETGSVSSRSPSSSSWRSSVSRSPRAT